MTARACHAETTRAKRLGQYGEHCSQPPWHHRAERGSPTCQRQHTGDTGSLAARVEYFQEQFNADSLLPELRERHRT